MKTEAHSSGVHPRLQARALSAGYRRRPVLTGIDLEVRPGEVVVLVGPNGAGKTTLLRVLGGLLRPLGGVATADGVPVLRLPPRQRARLLAYCPQQEAPPNWPLTVGDLVALGRTPHRGWVLPLSGHDRALVARVLERTGLAGLADRPVRELSGGEWQRALIARALAQEPSVLLLDEPVAYLDLRHQHQLLGLVGALAHNDGLAVVVTLHDLSLAGLVADRVLLLEAGRLAQAGTAAEVLRPGPLSRAYGLPVTVVPHPVFGTPMVVPAQRPGDPPDRSQREECT